MFLGFISCFLPPNFPCDQSATTASPTALTKSCSPFSHVGVMALEFTFLRRSVTLICSSWCLFCRTAQRGSWSDSWFCHYFQWKISGMVQSKKLLVSCKSLLTLWVKHYNHENHRTSARSSLMQLYPQLPPGLLHCPTKSSSPSHVPRAHPTHRPPRTILLYLAWL